MRTFKKSLLLLAFLFTPISGYCGTLTGTIQSILYYSTNLVFVQINGVSTNAPACATITSRMVIDITVPTGKAVLAHLMGLRLTNPDTVVSLVGTNACNVWSDTEAFSYTYL